MAEQRDLRTGTACEHCGTDSPDGADGCAECGMPAGPLPQPSADAPRPGPQPASRQTESQPHAGPQLTIATTMPRTGLSIGRPGRRAKIVGAVAGGLVLIVGAAALIVRLTAPAAETTVERFFAALAAGRAGEALSLVAGSRDSPLLTEEALAEERLRPKELTMEEPAEGSDTGDGYVRIDAKYRAGDATVQQTFRLQVTTAGAEPFLLLNPFVPVNVSGAAGRPVTVNGVPIQVDDEDDVLDAFPGAYSATAHGGVLLTASTTDGIPMRVRNRGLEARLRFEPPAVTPGAEAAVQEKVNRRLDE